MLCLPLKLWDFSALDSVYKNCSEIANFSATEKIKTALNTQDQGLVSHGHNLLKIIISRVAVTSQTQISVRNFGPKVKKIFFLVLVPKFPDLTDMSLRYPRA